MIGLNGSVKSTVLQFIDFVSQLVRGDMKGWKQLEIIKGNKGQESGIPGLFPRMTTEARHINDGMLHLIAILAELQSGHSFLLFDEIENGINPELVEFLIEALTSTDKQVLVTTHSPMILNYLSDEVAKSGVIYLYKTPIGFTKAIQFFSIPSIAEKLTVMGPGKEAATFRGPWQSSFVWKLLSKAELVACRREPDWKPAQKLLERIQKDKSGRSAKNRQKTDEKPS